MNIPSRNSTGCTPPNFPTNVIHTNTSILVNEPLIYCDIQNPTENKLDFVYLFISVPTLIPSSGRKRHRAVFLFYPLTCWLSSVIDGLRISLVGHPRCIHFPIKESVVCYKIHQYCMWKRIQFFLLGCVMCLDDWWEDSKFAALFPQQVSHIYRAIRYHTLSYQIFTCQHLKD